MNLMVISKNIAHLFLKKYEFHLLQIILLFLNLEGLGELLWVCVVDLTVDTVLEAIQ